MESLDIGLVTKPAGHSWSRRVAGGGVILLGKHKPFAVRSLTTMGKNKHTRTLIAGQLRTIVRHQRKIEEEIARPSPNLGRIRSWEKEIDDARRVVRKLEKRLGE